MLQAIVYTSNTGTTARYAQMLSKKLGLPAYTLEEAKKTLAPGADIVYMGWLMASGVKGYKKAAKLYTPRAVCGTGMGPSGSQLEEVRKQNAIPESIPVFTVQGGFYMDKLHGVNKLMMKLMAATAGKALAKKPDRTPEEEDMLQMLLHGGDHVNEAALQPLIAWYSAQ